ncbi:MAG: hypothetical protein R2828_16890 [Saprospiraceae bacterium]
MQNLIQLREGRMDNKIYDVDGGSESIDLSVEQFVADDGVERSYPSNFAWGEIVAVPNPFSKEFTLKFSLEQEEDVILKFFDQNGLLQFQKKYSLPKGSVALSIDQMGNLPNGYYTYQIVQSGKIQSGKVLKLTQ